ncbi:MAG: isocitrate lyase/phosphoenolpyruvate mutase family protein [Planctomycetes bacterium]|nr:isocitrate lyase/phosphoenolpyruvate mutase family protein [Planctomycetota bacterium]
MGKAAALRALLAGPGAAVAAGAHDGLGARLAEEAGFDAVWASGFELSASRGVPDANVLTMTESLEAARAMDGATRLPIIADCDNGFGNAINVLRTVADYERSGIAAICIEDNAFPKRCSFYSGVRRELVPVEEHVGKIRAAREARRDPDTVLIARTEALIAGLGQAEALGRARAYADAGADAVLVHSRARDFRELAGFLAAWDRPCPVVAVPTTYAATPVAEMARAGVRLVIYANQGLRASVRAVGEAFRALRRGGRADAADDRICTLEEVYRLIGVADLKAHEGRYLPPGQPPTRAVILAAGFDRGLMPLVADRPKALLEVRGRSILERQLEALRACGVTEVAVVRGWRKEAVEPPGVRCFDNDAYAETGEAVSLFAAEAWLEGRVLVLYGDLLFDRSILERLLRSPGDLCLVVDRSWLEHRGAGPRGEGPPDLVRTGRRPPVGPRFVPAEEGDRVVAIGRAIPPAVADGEFAGMALFSARGTARLRALWASLRAAGDEAPVHEAPSLRLAALTDLVQALMAEGLEARCVETWKGWTEVDSFEDYRRAWAEAR